VIDQSILQQHFKPVIEVVRFLDSSHLPPHLQAIVQPFEDLAADILRKTPSSPFLTVAMRALVSAKNEAVIAHIYALENGLKHSSNLAGITKQDGTHT
jgi:hypothetical protein